METRKKEVVHIPSHFMDPTRPNVAAALKIQKAFRGFLVRKTVQNILEIKTEIDQIEQRIAMPHTFDYIKSDSKEQLNVNEKLMRLLFRLDSVRGVRDLRKAVITKALVLQEIVDGIIAGDNHAGDNHVNCVEEKEQEQEEEQTLETLDEIERTDSGIESENCGEENEKQEEETVENIEKTVEREELVEKKECENEECDEKEAKGGVMEKIVGNNEKLVSLVKELLEQNALQTQMISKLSKRVENLERGIIRSDRLKRKMKRQTVGREKVDEAKFGRNS